MQLSEQARKAQRAYKKKWREANKDKIRESNRRYWEQKAKQGEQHEAESNKP